MRAVQRARDEQHVVLQMAIKIRWHGRVDDQPDEGKFLKKALVKNNPASPASGAGQESGGAPWGQRCAGLPHL